MFEIYVQKKFDAAHFLPGDVGKCSNLHGHSWKIEVTVMSQDLKNGMVQDFGEIKKILEDFVPDHTLLNDTVSNPTAENLAKYFYEELKSVIPGLTKVVVWESTETGAAYFEPEFYDKLR
jgi:6-pyruvoyltetrahydropterin/6-carboxytetrahydropterin synthase